MRDDTYLRVNDSIAWFSDSQALKSGPRKANDHTPIPEITSALSTICVSIFVQICGVRGHGCVEFD